MTSTEPATQADAQQLDTAIRQLAKQAHIVIEALTILVEQAKASNIHEQLGFPSWTAYLADALDGQWKLERDKRGEVVRFLGSQGMSQRAIAAAIGAGKTTVLRELAGSGGPFGPPEITGLDGKTYPRPEPKQKPEWLSGLESLCPWLSVPLPLGVAEDWERVQRGNAEAAEFNAGLPDNLPDTIPDCLELHSRFYAVENLVVDIRQCMDRYWTPQVLDLYMTSNSDRRTVLRRIKREVRMVRRALQKRLAVLEGTA
jgi:hypothetical protein